MLVYVQDPYLVAQSIKRLFFFQDHEQWNYLSFGSIGHAVPELSINHWVKQREGALCPSSIPAKQPE